MKTKYLLLFIVFFVITLTKAQKTYIPDDNFELKLIEQGYDSGPLDDSVLTADISELLFLDVSSSSISDLTGIEDFLSLISLKCNENLLTTINVANNVNLIILECHTNQLTSLDVLNNPSIKDLHCNHNQLTSINVSNNPILKLFNCFDNMITSIDITNNTALESLSIYKNQISHIDVSNNLALKTLSCSENLLTSLDLSNNLALEFLICRENQIESLDLSNNSNIRSAVCHSNQLESLNISNGNNTACTFFTANNNPDLYCIEVDNEIYSTSTWVNGDTYFEFDSQTAFSEDCSSFIGLEDGHYGNTFILYPMPISNTLMVELDSKSKYTIYTMQGQEVLLSGHLQNGKNTLDLSSLNTGLYTLNMTLENGKTRIEKLIKY